MRNLRNTLLVSVVAIAAATGAHAADLYEPPIIEPLPIEPTFASAWYLRGYVGISNQKVDKIDNALYATATSYTVEEKDFDESYFVGGGVGYKMNDWFRFDVTGEYRGKSDFVGRDSWTFTDVDGTISGTNRFDGNKTEWLFLANAYVDLGTWHSITPYVGAGIGGARISMNDFTDTDEAGNVYRTDGDYSTWNFAWALHAGVAYDVSPNLAFEVGYRYVDMGDARSGDILALDGTNTVYNPLEFKDVTSHDVFFGIRYLM
ncbi:outer membrane protein [Lutibaculum baratangense]|uniref:Outer membrane protein beta-barrel domain-containing protein n=1 Tax=Lutibaculum baratangense AMV1 TaxID=631454 RepID=V4RJ92_9HYPH|nr:outer membrane protein [Lutibaculum baratangense]ESR26166.1 hypothetical protein N177_1025 [Lutibaculum baratangense AMV1]